MTSLIQLKSLHNFKFDKLVEEQRKFHDEWIKRRKCECVDNLKEGRVMICEHYKKAKEIKFKNEEEKIKKLFSFLLKVDLHLNPQFPNNWLQRIKL